MNSKKIILSIFVIFAIFLMAANVFAANPGQKGAKPSVCNSPMISHGSVDLKITGINLIKYATKDASGNCGEITINTNINSGTDLTAMGIVVSVPLEEKSNYAEYMNDIYSEGSQEGKNLWKMCSGSSYAACVSPSNNSKVHKYYISNSNLCNSNKLDVYIFKPNSSGVTEQDNVSACVLYDQSGPAYITDFELDLGMKANQLYKITSASHSDIPNSYIIKYFYNLDYVYGVPFTSSNQGSTQEAPPNATPPATAITLNYSKLNQTHAGRIENFRDLSINDPIELVNDGLCTNPDYPYHLRMSGGTTGLDVSETYIGFVGPNTFSANKKDILDLIYNYKTPGTMSNSNSKIEWLTVSGNNSLIKADKFNVQKNGLNRVFCLSKVFAGKKLNIFVWQSKDSGNKINLGLGADNKKWTIPETDFYNTGYLDKINYEFGYVTELQIPTNPFSSGTPPAEATPNEGVVNNGESSDSSEGDSAQPENQPEPVASQQIKLDFTVFSTIPDVKYSTTNTWYNARKINDPEAYLIDYRNDKKSISVNLSSFNYTKPLYAIIATPDHSDKIYGYLANVKSTGDFKDYTLQSNFRISSNTLTTNPAAMEYTLGPDKTFKFSIDPKINDKFVLIFMQLSDAGSLINLAYTNLYHLDYNAQSIYQLCEINRNIINFYCKGYDCKVPGSCIDRWDFNASKLEGIQGIPVDAIPGAPTPPVTPTPPVETPSVTPTPPVETSPPVNTAETLTFTGTCSITKQETLEKYIECLRRNIETVNLSRKYNFISDGKIIRKNGPFLGNFLIDEKYNTNNKCYEEAFNNVVFKIAKQEGLSEEETAQLWSRIAAESGCNVKVGCGEVCGSTGVAQIHIPGWNDRGSYNSIKSELQKLKNWSSKYSTFSKYQSSLLGIANDPETALEISIAINRHNTNLIINKSKTANRPFLADMYQTYDQDDSIDMEFATSYVYAGSARASHFKDGVKIGATRWQGLVAPALNKMGYYLTYKRMIYLCHNDASTSNAFVTAYKNIYGGKYCK